MLISGYASENPQTNFSCFYIHFQKIATFVPILPLAIYYFQIYESAAVAVDIGHSSDWFDNPCCSMSSPIVDGPTFHAPKYVWVLWRSFLN